MPQIKKPDDLQSIANLIRFFIICMTIAFHDGISKIAWTLIYQSLHLAKSLPFTDTSMKPGRLSVNLNEILAESVEQRRFLKRYFLHIRKLKNPDEVS
ncbi:hypothetical protein [Ligilactobacillus ruminis]|uniref:hypothetical protein n=1 Tax=Ligilactobacillus ruminis TaxID=1623 RepID=UPI0022E777FF|nr:hypothetical protein [Ligilactobacillus ruminis]